MMISGDVYKVAKASIDISWFTQTLELIQVGMRGVLIAQNLIKWFVSPL